MDGVGSSVNVGPLREYVVVEEGVATSDRDELGFNVLDFDIEGSLERDDDADNVGNSVSDVDGVVIMVDVKDDPFRVDVGDRRREYVL